VSLTALAAVDVDATAIFGSANMVATAASDPGLSGWLGAGALAGPRAARPP
jgi:hypothetical protein